MAKLFKLKYVVIIAVLIAAVLFGSLISVSYAKWTGSGQTQIVCAVGTGKWITTEDLDTLFKTTNKDERDIIIEEVLEDLGGKGVIAESGEIIEMGKSFPMEPGDQFVIGGANHLAIEGAQIIDRDRYGIINGTSIAWMATNASKKIKIVDGVVTVNEPGNFKVVIEKIGPAEWIVIQDA